MLGQLSVVEVINNNICVLAKVSITFSLAYQQIMLNDHHRKFHHFINSRLFNLSGGSIHRFIIISFRMLTK